MIHLRCIYYTLLLIILLAGCNAFEPQLKCYDCLDCRDNFTNKGVDCDPRFYFCVYLEIIGGPVNRYCGESGNCTRLLLQMGDFGNCSMCSAPLCNEKFISAQPRSADVIAGPLVLFIAELLYLRFV